ncbi:uncharacterized protein LOC131878152 [Tigriopus californicus]|uniref:uncharacterized protein LOC131878152 n=1 Tax=Tigriopus californicus TaxID=6832 RepID=UPI0027D9D2BC|nr:uncharacterized protein LOC131878152 [Tigriopus californicus]
MACSLKTFYPLCHWIRVEETMSFPLILIFGLVSLQKTFSCQVGDPCFPDFDCSFFSVKMHCVQERTIYYGNIVKKYYPTTIEECLQKCLGHENCDNALYSATLKNCYVKHKKSHLTKKANMYTIPKLCIPDCTMDTVRLITSSVEVVSGVESLADCHAHCLQNPKCFGVVWSKPWTGYYPRTCRLRGEFRLGKTDTWTSVISQPRYCLYSREEPDGWYRFEGNNYKFLAQSNNFEEGQEICLSHGGQLASLESQEEYLFYVVEILPN